MSQARDTFYELLCEQIADDGYELKKSKGDFLKIKNGLNYSIQFSWDGRGGTTFLNGLLGLVEIPEIGKASKKLLAYELPVRVHQTQQGCSISTLRIPQMYSRKLIELANGMKFKEMAALPFEEKYPMANIQKTADVVANIIKNEVILFHNAYNDEKQLLDYYIMATENRVQEKDFHNIAYFAFPIKLMCKKLGIEEPEVTKNMNLFTNQSIDDLWNMQNHDFDTLEKKFNNLNFHKK